MSRDATIADVLAGRAQWCVHHGSFAQVLSSIEPIGVGAVVSDPPWGRSVGDTKAGARAVTDSHRFSGGVFGRERYLGMGKEWEPIIGDDEPFDPSPFLRYDRVILWGSNHFAQRLPVGTTLVWVKRSPELYGTFLSDAEVAWMKGGYGVYCFEKQFPPPSRMAESGNGQVAHPTQKPIGLMEWCLDRCRAPAGSVIFDPYMGSGSTGVAAIRRGFRFIGCEVAETFADTARRRIAEAVPTLFQPPREPDPALFGGNP